MKRVQDEPCRLVIVIGSHSGGTSATAGSLTKNGFYNYQRSGTFEATAPFIHLFRGPWHHETWRELRDEDFYQFARWAKRYKMSAIQEGYDKAVQKWPGNPIWIPEMFTGHCGIDVEPLLVWRDPHECARSVDKHWPDKRHGWEDTYQMAKERMEAIEKIHDTYGWPMWRFGKDADQDELGRLLNVELPVRYFEPKQIRNG